MKATPLDMTILRLPVKAGQSKKDKKKASAPERQRRLRIALCVGTILVLSLLLSLHLMPDKVSLQVGDVSLEEIRAHRTVRYIDSVETERLRNEAAARADNIYAIVPKAAFEAGESVSNIFEIVRRARTDETLASRSLKADFIRRNVRQDLSDESLTLLLTTDQHTLEKMEQYATQLVLEIMDREIREPDVRDARSEFRQRLEDYMGTARYQRVEADLSAIIVPNRKFDLVATGEAQEEEKRRVAPQYRHIYLGEMIIGKGERVMPEHIDKFTALGLRHPQIDYITVLCIGLLVAGVVLLTVAYVYRYHAWIYSSTKLLVLLSLIVTLSVLGLKLGGAMLGISLSGAQFGYFAMIWIATAGMLTAILLSPQLAVLVVALLSTISGLAMNHELRWALAPLVSSLVAIYAVSDIRHRSDLMRAGVAVSCANLGIVWLIGKISGDAFSDLLVGSGWALGGFGSVLMFYFGTAAFEKPFGITTHLRLLELSDTNHPILKRLLMEAPGTYSHSIFVGNIAAAAAEAVGADELLVRVASYYHDVGKMRRPHFFVENQHVENVHDRLNPSLSALVIRSHTKDGLELAREYKLPPLICELMSQHHGSSLVRYFYHQAAGEESNGSNALEQQFRYDGVKPQSREAAILMLADAAEAASRSLAKPTTGGIEAMVRDIIAEKLADGQLDESDLTFKDISRIEDSFIRTLTSMMRARIEYPEPPALEGKKVGNRGTGKEPPAHTGGSGKVDRGDQEVAAG